jgi:hypothetical protein
MKLQIYHMADEDNDSDLSKRVPSFEYRFISQNLLRNMKGGKSRAELLSVPFVLTLAAYLEAHLNDSIIIDTYAKHGEPNYRNLSDAYIQTPFKLKLRLIVSVLTDNTFQLIEESPTVKSLDKLIEIRNKIVHPRIYYQRSSKRIAPPVTKGAMDLTLTQCREFMRAVKAFDRLFLYKHGGGHIRSNALIRQVNKVIKDIE